MLYNVYAGEPLHCNNTEHLRHCAQHQCPAMFKCTGSYCIPLHMVCDDVADCQDKEDEIGCHQLECKSLLMVRIAYPTCKMHLFRN